MTLNLGVRIIYLKKPFIKKKSISHNIFNFYWSEKEKIKA